MYSKNTEPFVFYTSSIEAKSFFDEKAKKKRYLIKGHIDSEDLDLVNDIVTKSCMASISTQFKGRVIKLDFDHETLRPTNGESESEAKFNLTKIPLGKAVSEKTDSKGNFVEFELNPNWKKFNKKGDVVMTFKELWDNVQDGFFDAFSIAYIPTKTSMKNVNGIDARLLEDLNMINVALTGNAINPRATMTQAMAKSLEWLKSKEAKMEKKSYEKDGAHAHTENEPLGLHNHTEIEKRIQDEVGWIDRSIDRLRERISQLENNSSSNVSDSVEAVPGMKAKTKSGEKMTDEEVKKDAAKETAKPAEETKPVENAKPAENTDSSSSEAEAKSIKETLVEVKSSLDKANEKIVALEASNKELKSFVEKARPKGYGSEKKSVENVEAKSIGPLDML